MINPDKDAVISRFRRYIAVNTKSDPEASGTPSTSGQFDLARILAKELRDIGLSDVYLDEEHAYVYAHLPANTNKIIPKIAFIAHLDTAPDLDGTCVHPQTENN